MVTTSCDPRLPRTVHLVLKGAPESKYRLYALRVKLSKTLRRISVECDTGFHGKGLQVSGLDLGWIRNKFRLYDTGGSTCKASRQPPTDLGENDRFIVIKTSRPDPETEQGQKVKSRLLGLLLLGVLCRLGLDGGGLPCRRLVRLEPLVVRGLLRVAAVIATGKETVRR